MFIDIFTIFNPQTIIIFILIFTRLSTMIAVAPLFSTYPIPIQTKIWFMAIVSFIILPFAQTSSTTIIPSSMPLLLCFMLKEAIIGFTIGFVSNFLFNAVQMAGHLISMQSALSYSNVLNPTSGDQTPVISEFYVYLLTIIFLLLNCHHTMIFALYKSFETLPIGFESAPVNGVLLEFILKSSAGIFSIALNFILPIFCIMFIFQVLLGIVAKTMPQMNIFMVAMPFQITLAIILMIAFLKPMFEYLCELVQTYFITILKVFSNSI